MPFFTKGVPEVLPDIARVLVSNETGKYLYAAVFLPDRIDSAVYSDGNFAVKLKDVMAV